MNAEQWEARVKEVGFVKATKELITSNVAEEPVTRAEVKEMVKALEKK